MNWLEREWRKHNPTKAKIQDAVQKEISKICRLYRNGYFPREIARELLLPIRPVSDVISNLGLHRRYNKQDIRNKLNAISNLPCSDLIVISIKSVYERKEIEEIVRLGTISYDKNGIVISNVGREIKWKDVIDVSIYKE